MKSKDDLEDEVLSDPGQTNVSFTKHKWSNIDELIQVLQEEIVEAKKAKKATRPLSP